MIKLIANPQSLYAILGQHGTYPASGLAHDGGILPGGGGQAV